MTSPGGLVVPFELGGPEKRPAALAESAVRRPKKKRPTVLVELTPASMQMHFLMHHLNPIGATRRNSKSKHGHKYLISWSVLLPHLP